VENWGPQDFCVAMSDDYDRTRRSLLIREPCVDLLHNTYDFRGQWRGILWIIGPAQGRSLSNRNLVHSRL